MIDLTNIAGLLAGTLTTVSFVPQVVRSVRTKSTKDISWYLLIILLAGLVLWDVYGVMINSFPLVLANTISIFVTFPMVVLKLKYG